MYKKIKGGMSILYMCKKVIFKAGAMCRLCIQEELFIDSF